VNFLRKQLPGFAIHLLLFLLSLLYAFNAGKIPTIKDYMIYFKVHLEGQWEVSEGVASAPVLIEESEIESLKGKKRAFLLVKRIQFIPKGKRFELFGNVNTENNKVFISTYVWDLERLPERKTLRDFLMEKFKEKVRDEHLRAIGLAFLFGESKRNLPVEVERVFLHTGLIHVLVVSGLHVGLIFLILSRLLPKFYGEVFGLLGVLFYSAFLVPHNPPVIRATSMLFFWVLSFLSFRWYCSLCVLFFTGTLMLSFFPHFFYSYSFWLSFFAVLYILLVLRNFEGGKLAKTLMVSFSAFSGTAPLIASFSFITPLSVLLTPVLSPLIFAYALFGVLSLLTAFSFPPSLILMNLSGEIIFKILQLFSDFSPKIISGVDAKEAFTLLVLGAVGLYVTKDYYKLLPLGVVNLYLIFKIN